MSEPLAYWRDQFVLLSEVKLGINDAGFVFGATATDLCRTFRHQLYRLEDHLIRFRRSCTDARVPCPWGQDALASIAQELVERNARLLAANEELVLVMFATPGEIGYYLGQPGGAGDGPPTLCMHTFSLPFHRYANLFRTGARLVTIHGWSSFGVPAHIKHRSRLHWWLAQHEARARNPNAQPLMVRRSLHVTETATANFLVVSDGKVCSPPRVDILNGVSLQMVQDLCLQLDIAFEEGLVRSGLGVFLHPDEALLTSTPYCLVPVSRIDSRDIPFPGPVFEGLLKAWSDKVGVDIRGQFLNAS